MTFASWLEGVWYGARAPLWLKPMSALFGAVSGARRFGYAKGWFTSVRLDSPLVVIGNITVGGTGKTPLVIWLCEALAQRGLKPGVVSRGYGGNESGARLVQPSDQAALVGDEPLLMARRLNLPVAVGRDRPRAAQLLLEAGCRVVVSDDGLQHLALQRDCEIVVMDAVRQLGNGALLPAGPLREPAARLRSVAAVVSNGESPALLDLAVPQFSMHLTGGSARSLAGLAERPLASFADAPVHAVAGIGHPERFFAWLRLAGLEVIAHPLPDHALIRREDIHFADGLQVLMTEKDAVKCAQIAGREHWSVPVEAAFTEVDGAQLLEVVLRAIGASNVAKGEHG
jgi:tetraacyldisaccharide 4'-kinase